MHHHTRLAILTVLVSSASLIAGNAARGQSTAPAAPPTTAAALSPAQQKAADLYQQGLALQDKGQLDAAVEKFKEATTGVEYAPALNHYAWLQSGSPHAEYRNGKRAVEYALRAVAAATQANGPARLQADCLDTLCVAYADAGDFDAALATANKGRDLCRKSRLWSRVALFASRIKLFDKHQPYHDTTQPAD